MSKKMGILAAGYDVPGLNAAIRSFGKAAIQTYKMDLIGFQDGFGGLLTDQVIEIQAADLSNILTAGGTILGTSRAKPRQALQDEAEEILSGKAAEVYKRRGLDGLIIIGGHHAIRAAAELCDQGLNILALPKALDNHVKGSEVAIGYKTAIEIATEAIDRLHGTAFTHHQVMIVEVMGMDAGWLTLASGMAGGADVILIPEIPYRMDAVIEKIQERNEAGKRFTIVAAAESAQTLESVQFFEQARRANEAARNGAERDSVAEQLAMMESNVNGSAQLLANRIEASTHLDCRITILGYLLRGGTPSAGDRILATQLGAVCADYAARGEYGKLIGIEGEHSCATELNKVAGLKRTVPLDHVWLHAGRLAGISFGE